MNESSQETKRLLIQLAYRAQNEEGLMARVLMRYQQLEKMNDDALAAQLQTDALGLARLALCKLPVSDARFAEQVRKIATYAKADPAQIASVIRYVESMDALAQKPATQVWEETTTQPLSKWSGVVAAARDRDEIESENDTRSPSPPNVQSGDRVSEDDDVAGAGEPKDD